MTPVPPTPVRMMPQGFGHALIVGLTVALAAMLTAMLTGCASGPRPAAPRAPGTAPLVAPGAGVKTFMGMTEAGLRQALGNPAFVRKEGVTQMWRYDGPSCRAFFFLSAPAANTNAAPVLAVRHVETLPRGAAAPADPACLAGLGGRAVSPSPPKVS